MSWEAGNNKPLLLLCFATFNAVEILCNLCLQYWTGKFKGTLCGEILSSVLG